jgi:hypothetical protein
MSQVCPDYADLFCALFDGIDAAEFRANREAWLAEPQVHEIAAQVEAAMLAGDWVTVHHPFAALLCIDAAFARVNPLLSGPAPGVLSEFALRYAEAGRFDSGRGPGALLPRFAGRVAGVNCRVIWPTPSEQWFAYRERTGKFAITSPSLPMPG